MEEGFRCPRCGFGNPAVTAVSDALRAIGGELSLAAIRQTLVDAAREVAGARYAALGIAHEDGGFSHFVTSGMTEEEIEAIGPIPRAHGLLGATLEDPRPFRTANIQADPRFEGWPDEHPDMLSFMGVPVVSEGAIIGAFYFTDKVAAPAFTAADQEAIEMLASHAVVAIKTARLWERNRELSVVEERNRLARELHDAVSQTLFSVVLTAEAAAHLVLSNPEKARAQIAEVAHLVRAALQEMRSLIFELRPAEIERDGLVPTLRKHVDVLRRVYPAAIEMSVDGERRLGARAERELFRIAQEALHNALKHAGARSVRVEVTMAGGDVRIRIGDDGRGFDPASPRHRSKSLGLTSMEERAVGIGGRVRIDSELGAGTTVCVEVPLAR